MKKTILLAIVSLLLINCGNPKKEELGQKTKKVQLITEPINDSLFSVEVVSAKEGLANTKTKLGVSSNDVSQKLIQYTRSSDEIHISSTEKANPWHITFKKSGINELFAIHKFGFRTPEEGYTIHTNTDFIGPYVMRDVKNEEEIKSEFTGGWHGSNGDATGEPTGKTIKWNVYDKEGNTVKANKNQKSAQQLWIEVVNHIQPYSSKKEIIKETVHYEVHPFGLNVHIEIEALEDVQIETYYGIQSQNPYFFNEVVYHFEDLSQKKEGARTYNQSNDNIDKNKVTHYTLTDEGLTFQLAVWLDANSDLANGEYLEENKPWAFTAGYGKSYFNLVNGKKLNLQKGRKIDVRGGYYFLEKGSL